MSLLGKRIADNLNTVRERIAAACGRAGRDVSEVQLVAVTKAVGLPEMEVLLGLGERCFGENRINVAQEKIAVLGDKATWHMIGSVQRRKAKDVVELFDTVDSIDRVEVAEALNKRCAEAGKTLSVLIEVNVSGEASKHGFTPANLREALDSVGEMSHLKVDGLMTMAPYTAELEETRPVFAGLRELAHEYGLAELSMGMSNDYEIAVEEGATQVRIGSALYK